MKKYLMVLLVGCTIIFPTIIGAQDLAEKRWGGWGNGGGYCPPPPPRPHHHHGGGYYPPPPPPYNGGGWGNGGGYYPPPPPPYNGGGWGNGGGYYPPPPPPYNGGGCGGYRLLQSSEAGKELVKADKRINFLFQNAGAVYSSNMGNEERVQFGKILGDLNQEVKNLATLVPNSEEAKDLQKTVEDSRFQILSENSPQTAYELTQGAEAKYKNLMKQVELVE